MSPAHVDSYCFGRIVVDGQAYGTDLIIRSGEVLSNWRRAQGHYLQLDDLGQVLADPPEVLVVGQGAVGRMAIAPEVEEALTDAGIELVAEWSGKACQAYNDLQGTKRTALAIHLTC